MVLTAKAVVDPAAQVDARVREVFQQVELHRRAAEIVRHHSLNPIDIHRFALSSVDSACVNDVLDLGCGFGSFVQPLSAHIRTDVRVTGIDIIPACEPLFLAACKKAGFSGQFHASGVSWLDSVREPSFDLILASYSLYFFPDAVSNIYRCLRNGGVFITITHERSNLGLLARLVREYLVSRNLLQGDELPVETLIGRFCAENGESLLREFFGEVRSLEYVNSLMFSPEEVESLEAYFRFRSPFYLMGTPCSADELVPAIICALEKESLQRNGLRLSKNDRIFICRKR